MKLTKRGKFAVLVLSALISWQLGNLYVKALGVTAVHRYPAVIKCHHRMQEDDFGYVKLVNYDPDNHKIVYRCQSH